MPNARQKLNSAAVNGALIVASVAGWLTASWVVFIVVGLLVLVGNLQQGVIRPRGTRR